VKTRGNCKEKLAFKHLDSYRQTLYILAKRIFMFFAVCVAGREENVPDDEKTLIRTGADPCWEDSYPNPDNSGTNLCIMTQTKKKKRDIVSHLNGSVPGR